MYWLIGKSIFIMLILYALFNIFLMFYAEMGYNIEFFQKYKNYYETQR
jgi:hypothetical protein